MKKLFFIFIVLILTSCASTKRIEPVVLHDTVKSTEYINTIVHDSVDKWHTHYEYVDTCGGKSTIDTFYYAKYLISHDTIRTDSIIVKETPVEVIVEKVEHKMVWWPFVVTILLTALLYAYIKWIK